MRAVHSGTRVGDLMRGVLFPLVSHWIRLFERHARSETARPDEPASLIIISTALVEEEESDTESAAG